MVVLRACRLVYKHNRYRTLSVCVTLAALFVVALLPHTNMLSLTWGLSNVAPVEKMKVTVDLLLLFGTHPSLFITMVTILTSVLLGVYAALFTYTLVRANTMRTPLRSLSVAGIGGYILGLLGLGCGACGSLVLTPLLTSLGIGGMFAVLPFHGRELGIIGVALLSLGIVMLSRTLLTPRTCIVP